MGLSVRLRIELADRPGSLAEVAGIIGAHGGNITGIDVHTGADAAVDEVTVEFADDLDLATVRRAIVASGSARVLSHQAARPVDHVTRVLRRMTALADDPSEVWEAGVRRMAAELCATPAVWFLPPDVGRRYQAGAQALARAGEAVVTRTKDKLPPLGETIDGEAWLLAIASVAPAGERVLLVARPMAQGFTLTEVGRIEALVGLQQRIAALRERPAAAPAPTG